VAFKEKLLIELVEKSNCFFKNLKVNGHITERFLKYFTFKNKKAANLGKLYLLPKIHKRLDCVPGRPVISNCGAPTEKVSEFLDYHLKPIMQTGQSYIKDSNDFQQKVRQLSNIPKGALLVTADVVALYPSIPHHEGLSSLREALDKRVDKKIPTDTLMEMSEFVLKNNFFEFDQKVYQQISGTAIGTKFAPPYACIFLDQLESSFMQTETRKPLNWFRYIDDIFFVWTHGEDSLHKFMSNLNKFNKHIKITYDFSKEHIPFLDLNVSLAEGKLFFDLYMKSTDCHQYLHYTSSHPEHTK